MLHEGIDWKSLSPPEESALQGGNVPLGMMPSGTNGMNDVNVHISPCLQLVCPGK